MIRHLLVKKVRREPLTPVGGLRFTESGIVGGVPCPPLRQVLILPLSVLSAFGLLPGELRENVVIDYDPLHSLPSGTVLKLGEALVRLTFHCEPCVRVSPLVPASKLLHNRGYLGAFLNAGTISLDDPVTVVPERHEPIPYEIRERLAWYLDRRQSRITAPELLWEVGLSLAYARALPKLLLGLPAPLRDKVVFVSHGMSDRE